MYISYLPAALLGLLPYARIPSVLSTLASAYVMQHTACSIDPGEHEQPRTANILAGQCKAKRTKIEVRDVTR